ncbi:MAG: allantoate amidohydrolase [Acidobacteriaceae bacterium]
MSATLTRHGAHASAASAAAARLMQRCALLAKITERPGEILRTFLSPAMDEVHRTMRPWMESAGMAVSVDRAGNLRGVYPVNADTSQPRLLIGSHLDTVPNAGAYDGILGVLAGIALVEAIAGRSLPYAIEVIGFSDEEGTRFGAPFLGSRAVVGELSGSLLDCVDTAGVTVRAALEDFAARRPETVPANLSARSAAYLEFHIEQGPVLENRNLALGIVEGLAGQTRSHVVFRGCAGHAGTTPMNMRRDALAAASEWMTRVEEIVARFENAVATVGQIQAEPGAVNVIPGVVRCSLDVRHGRDAVRDAALYAIFDEARAIGKRRGIDVETEPFHTQAAVHLDEGVVALAERAAKQAGYSAIRMTSGAGHDAMVMAPHVPTAMIFLRNPGGLSHHPDESVAESDVAAALHAGLCFLDEFAAWLNSSVKKVGQ